MGWPDLPQLPFLAKVIFAAKSWECSKMPNEVTGGCLCGEVRFATTAQPTNVLFCHCAICRRATGQPIVAGAYFETKQVKFLTGEPRRHRSSPYADRGFCEQCGTPVFYHSVMPELRDWMCLMLGTLDHPERYPPTAHWNVETALSFSLHNDGLPRHLQADSQYWWVRDSISKNE